MARRLDPSQTSNPDVMATIIANGSPDPVVFEDPETAEVIADFGDAFDFRSSVAAVAEKMPPRPRHILDAAKAKVESLTRAARLERKQAATNATIADWRPVVKQAIAAGSDRDDIYGRWGAAVNARDASTIAAIGQEAQAFLATVAARRERAQVAVERLRRLQGNA